MTRGAVLFLLFFLFLTPKLRAQSSPLSTGQWVKISVGKQGIFQITGAQFKAMGFTLPITSNQVQLFSYDLANLDEKVSPNNPYGLFENAIEVQDGGDGQIEEKEGILFYSEGPVKWKYNESDGLPFHVKKSTGDSVYFFLTLGKNGKRVSNAASANTYAKSVDTYDERWLIEKDTISILNSGQLWLGAPMGQGLGKQTKLSFPINSEGIDAASAIKFKMQYAASSYQGPANFNLQWNGQSINNTAVAAVSGLVYDDAALVVKANADWLLSSSAPLANSATIYVDFSSSSSNSTGWIDFIELHAKRSIGFWGTRSFGFRNFLAGNARQGVLYKIQKADTTTIVWDVTHPFAPVKMAINLQLGGVGSFIQLGDTINDFYTVQQQAYELPTYVGKLTNQNVLATPNADYIIIAPSAFKNAATQLQQYHKAAHNLKVEVLVADEIYNEFSGGQVSAIGVRNCIKYLFDKATLQNTSPPKYLLLLGLGNYDPRKINSATQLPAYESVASTATLSTYTSDDFYAILKDGYDINIPSSVAQLSLAVGRIPARNIAEADTAIRKIIQYQKNINGGVWKNQLAWVADDGDYNLHLQDAEEITSHLQGVDADWNQKKMYLDLYQAVPTTSGNTYPSLITELKQVVNNGALVFNYSGHGNYLRLAEEAVVTSAEFAQWDNAGKLPLMITASCDFAPYDQPQLSPIAFDAFMKDSKGVIGVVAASRLVFAYSNKQINDEFIQQLLVPNSNGKFQTTGESLMLAKNKTWSNAGDHINAFKFNLIGDPAMYLASPKYKIKIDAINQKQFVGKDTLAAGDVYKVKGSVQSNGSKINTYNGVVEMVLYDAVSYKKTLANQTSSMSVFVETQDQIVFKGKATVLAGDFEINFVLPKELNALKGALKLQLYAYNDTADAIGVFNQIYVSVGTAKVVSDTTGPFVKGYINDTNFVDGGWVTDNAKLIVRLKDSAGIQSSGNALGHDITLIIDRDFQHPIALNNYYTADMDSYQSGTVLYSLPNFSEGTHELIVKAWDLFSNATADTIRFIVPPTQKLLIRNFSIFPNPFNSLTQFSFEHNQAATPLSVVLDIYDYNGLKIYSKSIQSLFLSNRVVLNWSGLTTGGNRILPGIYYCRLSVSDAKLTTSLTRKVLKY